MSKEEYLFTMDIYPQEHKEETRLWPFFENLKRGKLTTTKCNKCSHIFWPPEVVCPECLSDDLEYVDMPEKGKIYAFTVQVGAIPPGFEPPLVQAIIDFENGIRIIGPLIDMKPEDVKVGDEVKPKVVDIPPDPHGNRVLFVFEKA